MADSIELRNVVHMLTTQTPELKGSLIYALDKFLSIANPYMSADDILDAVGCIDTTDAALIREFFDALTAPLPAA
jgi:hypothetical protein